MTKDKNTQSWYQFYAPTDISEYVFENSTHKDLIESFLNQGSISGNLLLTGAPGTGKTSIATILIKNLITHQNNYQRVKARSVSDIDELGQWLKTMPIGNQKKIVLLEEFDKLGSAAVAQLKDSLMEKYQETVSFIATTNHKQKIDDALLSRFNYQLEFTMHRSNDNIAQVLAKCETILKQENVQYDIEDLTTFVSNNASKGLRAILSSLQIASNNNIFDITNITRVENAVSNSSQEFEVVNLIHEIITIMLGTNLNNSSKINCYKFPAESAIKQPWRRIQQIIFTTTVSFDLIYNELISTVKYAPLFEVLDDYANPKIGRIAINENVTFMAFLSKLIKAII